VQKARSSQENSKLHHHVKNIKLEYYWSSSIVRFTQYPVESAWAQNFKNSDNEYMRDQYFFPLTSLQNVRAIKVTYFDFKITNIIAMNDFILAVYSENVLGLGVYYDPSILSTIVATST
jgi:hypothetical protein